MENLTNVEEVAAVAEEVAAVAVEEVTNKVGFGVILTGGCALVGAFTIGVLAVKGVKWGVGKVKELKESKVEVLDAEEAAKMEAKDVESTQKDPE